MTKRIDLLNGGILTSLTRLALPIMATSFLQMAYNLTDMIWIGRMGSNPVAAVGAASMYLWLSNALAILARMGGQVKVAQAMGAKDEKSALAYAQNAIHLCTAAAILYSLVMLIFAGPLISFFKLNGAEVIRDAEIYLRIVGGGLFFNMLNQLLTGLMTATGNSKSPFAATTVGLVINIILDPVLIFGLGPIPSMGVAGAAWATLGAQIVVFAIFVMHFLRDKHLFAKMKLLVAPNLEKILDIIKIGLPTAAQSAVMTVIAMIIARLVAGWGDAAIAVQKVGSQIESISWMTSDGFGVAINSFIAQNHGAGNESRAQKGYKTAFIVMTGWGILSSLLLITLAGPIFSVFIPEPDILPLGVSYLVIQGLSQLFMCWEIITAGAFAGYSRSLPPSVVSAIFTAMRIPLAMVLSATPLGLNGIWWSITISSICKGLVVVVLFFLFLRKRRIKAEIAESV